MPSGGYRVNPGLYSYICVVPWSSTVRSGCRQLVLYSQPLGTLAFPCCYGPSLSLPLLLPYGLLGFQGLSGPVRSCWPVQARPTCRRALHMLPLVRSLLITLTALRFCGPSSRLTCGLSTRRRAGCSQWPLHGETVVRSLLATLQHQSTATLPYSYSTADLQPLLLVQRLQPLLILQLQDLLRDVQPPTMACSAPGAHTHTGFFFKGFLPLDTREPRISFSPNHFTLYNETYILEKRN